MVSDAAVTTFKSSFRGAVIQPGDAGYDAARKVYNGMIDRRPGLIVKAVDVADVVAAVNFARAENLFNTQYEEVFSYRTSGFAAFTGFKFRTPVDVIAAN